MAFILAPLRGVTGLRFRIAFAHHFGGLERAVAPFIATVAGKSVKAKLLAGILPDAQPPDIALTPQVIGRDPDQLRTFLHAIRTLGYTQCDLNAGCPWPFIVKKGRGSGLLADEPALRAMLEAGCDVLPNGFSIKVRLGVKTPDLLETRMALLNTFPLREVCIHPRTAAQMYEGHADVEAFARAATLCRHPLIYNGDIQTTHGFLALQAALPSIQDWMIGRGLCMNPFLLEMITTGEDTRSETRLRAFLEELRILYGANGGGSAVVGRMKELWSYLHLGLVRGDHLWNTLKLTRTEDEYRRVVDSLPLRFKDEKEIVV